MTTRTNTLTRLLVAAGAVVLSDGSRGFLLEAGDLNLIDATPGAVFTRPLDINNQGQIVGDYATRPPAGARSSRVDTADQRAGTGLLGSFRGLELAE